MGFKIFTGAAKKTGWDWTSLQKMCVLFNKLVRLVHLRVVILDV